MDDAVAALIDRVRASGIQMKVWKGTVRFSRLPPDALLAELRNRHEEIHDELWRQQGRERQAKAIVRLAEDRAAWIEESKRLGKYREPGP